MSVKTRPTDSRLNHHQPYRRWLTQQEAAEYIGVTDRTIRALVRRGELRGYRVGSRMVRIDVADIDKLLRPIPTVGGAPDAA